MISGVDAVAPGSAPSSRISSYRCEKGRAGVSVSGEDHLPWVQFLLLVGKFISISIMVIHSTFEIGQ